MTAAQTAAKAKFKKAIAYRQKTGVSLKEAFAHVYGKKVGAAPKKKAAKKSAKKVVKKAAPKKVAGKKIGLSIVKKASAKVKRLARKAQDAYYEGFYEGKPAELAKKRAELKAKRVSAAKKKVSEQSILNKIRRVKNEVSELDKLQNKHMIGKISQHNVNKIKSSLQELQQLERHLSILKNVKPKIVKSQLPVIRKEIKNTVNSIKEVKTHIAQLKKSI
jgi:adenylate kinase